LHEQDPQIIHGDLRSVSLGYEILTSVLITLLVFKANVVVNEDHRLLLIDFGVAKVEQIQTVVTSAGESHGTIRWMAPEIFRGSGLSTRTDTYAFAMTCLEVRLYLKAPAWDINGAYQKIFSGTHPFPHIERDVQVLFVVGVENRRPERPKGLADARGLNDDLWRLIESCWDQDPLTRPSMSNVLLQLDRIAQILVSPCTPIYIFYDFIKRCKTQIPITASPMMLDNLSNDFGEPLDGPPIERNDLALSRSHSSTSISHEPPSLPPSPQLRWLQSLFSNFFPHNFPGYNFRLPSVSGGSESTTVPQVPLSEISDVSDQLLTSPGIKRRRSISPPTPRKALTYSEVVKNRSPVVVPARTNGVTR
jgi:hypothetical protein